MSDGSIGSDQGTQVSATPGASGDASHGAYRFVDMGPSLRRRTKREEVPQAVHVRLSEKAQRQLKEFETREGADGDDRNREKGKTR